MKKPIFENLMFEYMLNNRVGLREVADTFDISLATAHRIVNGKPMSQAVFLKVLNVLFKKEENK